MIKDDWLIKLIRQMAKVMHDVHDLVSTGNLDEAETMIERMSAEYLGFDWRESETLSADDLIAIVSNNEQAGVGQMLLLADMLRTSGEIELKESGDEELAYPFFLKALQIRLNLALGHDLSNAHLDGNIDELIVGPLSGYVLPTDTTLNLFTYYEKSTQYDKAEEILWELIEDHITTDDMNQFGLAFYERLLLLDDTQLNTGNLNRADVDKGFEDLWARTNI